MKKIIFLLIGFLVIMGIVLAACTKPVITEWESDMDCAGLNLEEQSRCCAYLHKNEPQECDDGSWRLKHFETQNECVYLCHSESVE